VLVVGSPLVASRNLPSVEEPIHLADSHRSAVDTKPSAVELMSRTGDHPANTESLAAGCTTLVVVRSETTGLCI
jgi:hypothetical protein